MVPTQPKDHDWWWWPVKWQFRWESVYESALQATMPATGSCHPFQQGQQRRWRWEIHTWLNALASKIYRWPIPPASQNQMDWLQSDKSKVLPTKAQLKSCFWFFAMLTLFCGTIMLIITSLLCVKSGYSPMKWFYFTKELNRFKSSNPKFLVSPDQHTKTTQ